VAVSAFEVDDATSATGRRLAIPEGTLPANIDNVSVDPTGWNQADGFSPAAPIGDGVSRRRLRRGPAPPDNMDLSVAADSPTCCST